MEKVQFEDYPNGIPKEEFEGKSDYGISSDNSRADTGTQYLMETRPYYWVRLGCFNYRLPSLGTSLRGGCRHQRK